MSMREESDIVYSEKLERDVEIRIFRDDFAQSPHDWENDDAFLVYEHRQFNVDVEGFKPREIFEVLKNNNIPEAERDEDWIYDNQYDEYKIFVVYAYIHSGVSLSLGNSDYPFNDRWDVSTTGFVVINKAEFDNNEETMQKAAESLIKDWNDYLSGNVYGWEVLEKNIVVDSTFGYYGDYNSEGGCLAEARAFAKDFIIQIKKSDKIMHT